MNPDRRRLLTWPAAATAFLPAGAAAAAPISALGLDGAQFGLRPGGPDDQSRTLQRAIEAAANVRAPLALAPGVYRVGNLRLPAGAQLVGDCRSGAGSSTSRTRAASRSPIARS